MTTKVKSSVIDTVANTQITGLITAGQIASIANTQITGLILPGQLAGAAGVASVSVTSPVTNSGTSTAPNIGMPAATSGQNGFMTSTYASKLDGIAAGATNVTNTNQLTNGAGYVTSSSLSGYATTSFVTSQGYITSSSLSGYASLSALNTWSNNNLFQGISTTGIAITNLAVGINFSYLTSTSITADSSNGVAINYGGATIAKFFTNNFTVGTDNVFKPSGGAWLAASDRRLKENVTNYTKGLNELDKLRTVNFNFIGKLGEQTNKKTITGLIAQDVLQTQFANIVNTSPDGMYNIDSSELVYALVNAVQELNAEVKALKAKLPK